MSPTTAPQTLPQLFRTLPTGMLLDDLLTAATAFLEGDHRPDQVAAACVVLQQRCGRQSAIGSRDTTDPAQALADQVDGAGGFLVITADRVRAAAGARFRAAMLAPEPGQVLPTHEQVLQDVGLAAFPGPALPAGMGRFVLYDPAPLLGRLLAALTAREPTGELVDEIRTAATVGAQ
jgi:hypothetical protein